MFWKLIDRETGAENHAISWTFTQGDRVKIRLVNEMDSDHPMHHPFHVHGAAASSSSPGTASLSQPRVEGHRAPARGRDRGHPALRHQPGLWMAHCHIAEHTESGMMFSFDVAEARPRNSSQESA
jgi:FtsP/CotA-like multicopper oxidase with cupredoxin domain